MKQLERIICILTFILFISGQVKSQNTFPVQIEVLETESEKVLKSVVVYVNELQQKEITDPKGTCLFNLPAGTYTIELRMLGYAPQSNKLCISGPTQRKFLLPPTTIDIEEVRVVKNRRIPNDQINRLSTVCLTGQEMLSVPNFGGICDPLKIIQLLPGVSSGGDGSSEFFVRGGESGQNVVILDNAPVFNPNHLLGFFSVLNPEVISSLELYKGNMPATKGGRASSIMDIKLRSGDANNFRCSALCGNIASELTVDIPLMKGKSSMLISGRRAYPDIYLKVSPNKKLKDSQLNFYDLNIKSNCIINDRQRITLSFYSGGDKMSTQNIFTDWANKVASINWDQAFGDQLFSRTSIFGNKFNYQSGYEAQNRFTLNGGLNIIGGKQDFLFQINKNTTASLGFSMQQDRFDAGDLIITSQNEIINQWGFQSSLANESSLFLAGNFSLGSKFNLDLGARFSFFTRDEYYEQNTRKSEFIVAENTAGEETLSTYNNFEPRINLRYSFSENQFIVASYNRMAQYIHLLQSNTTNVPMDYWIPCSKKVKPQLADQWSIGYHCKSKGKIGLEFSVESYYKNLNNAMDYQPGADILMNNDVENELIFGKGRAYGLELLLKKQAGSIQGWISYTLSRTEKRIDGINNYTWYPARQDRTHDFAIVLSGRLSQKFSLSANWIYYTGHAVTFPIGKYLVSGSVVNFYGERNSDRMPDYHRLDIGAKWILKKNRTGESYLNFSLFNAYGRKNAYAIFFKEEKELSGITETIKVYLFSVVPSISLGYKF